jgi:hypothetical protein
MFALTGAATGGTSGGPSAGSRHTAVTYGVRKHTVHGGTADLEPLGDLRGTKPFVLQPQDLGRVDCRRPPLCDPFELALAT